MIKVDTQISDEYLIALNNNLDKFFDRIETLLESVKKVDVITDEDIQESFNQRTVQANFAKITKQIVQTLTDDSFKKVNHMYDVFFLDLDLEDVLFKTMKILEDFSIHMSKTTDRESWKSFLKRTVINYIQCMLNSTSRIKSR